jgi:hypothetical protein
MPVVLYISIWAVSKGAYLTLVGLTVLPLWVLTEPDIVNCAQEAVLLLEGRAWEFMSVYFFLSLLKGIHIDRRELSSEGNIQ